jgi:hypothetical protein
MRAVEMERGPMSEDRVHEGWRLRAVRPTTSSVGLPLRLSVLSATVLLVALPSTARGAKPRSPSVRPGAATPSARHAQRSASNLLFGAYVPPSPENGMAALDQFQGSVGTRVDVVLWFQHWDGWGTDFNPDWVSAVAASGRLPLLTWEPWAPGSVDQPDFQLRRIANGAFDSYVRRWAEALAAYGKTVYLRPMHEMNGDWYPWSGVVNGNTPADYVAAWRHLHDLFREEGAANVRWVWCAYARDVPASNRLEAYYPGSAYVDVLALDGYNWGATSGHHWETFDQLFSRAYGRVAALGTQQVWITETASESAGGDKAAWVRDMFKAVPRYPRLHAIVWFNLLKERDWRATTPPGTAAAFAAAWR